MSIKSKLNKQDIKGISNMRCLFCWKGNINMKTKIRSPCSFFLFKTLQIKNKNTKEKKNVR